MISNHSQILKDLLSSRNRCLIKMKELSLVFITDLSNANLVERAEALENKRSAIIKAIDLFNRKIDQTVCLLDSSERTSELTEYVRKSEQDRERLLAEIIKSDAEVAKRIHNHCEQLNQEFTAAKRNQEQVSRFKSQWVPTVGEEIDSNL